MAEFKNLEKQSAINDKVIAMSSASVQAIDGRPITKDDRRLIMLKLDEVHDGEKYIKDWSDEKIAKDLGVKRVWVTQVRETGDYGPDINEQTSILANATQLVVDMKREWEARIKSDEKLMLRAAQIEAEIRRLKS